MKYRPLGRTGIHVSPYALGTMNFGAMANADHDETASLIRTALDAGINLIDTADVYSRGESEQIIGKAIAGRREEVVLATKFSNPMGDSPTSGAGRDAGSPPPSKARCGGWAPSTSTCTSTTTQTTPPTWKRPCRR